MEFLKPISTKEWNERAEELLIACGAVNLGAQMRTSSASEKLTVVDCCWKPIAECLCSSTSSKEEEHIFTGSTYNLEEFAVTKHVMQLVSSPDLLGTLFKDLTYEHAATEFTRLVKYIELHPEPGRSELACTILPLTIHLYALLMQDEDIGVSGARMFLRLHAMILRMKKDYIETLKALKTFDDIENLKQDSRFQHYFEHKTIIRISEDTFKSLQDFLKVMKKLGYTLLLSVLSFNIDFVDCDLVDCDVEDKITKNKDLSDELKKNDTDVGGKEELKPEEAELKNIDISRIFIYPKKLEHVMTVYDFDKEEMFVMDDVSDYTETKKKPKNVVFRQPVRLRNPTRNVANRFKTPLKPILKKAPVAPKVKKVPEVVQDPALVSLHSVDFNCSMTEIAYVTGDDIVYTLAITTPEEKNKKTIDFIKDTTVNLRTYEHNESGLKSTRVPENEKVYVVKYLPEDPFSLLVACSSIVRLFNTKTCSFEAEYVKDGSFIYDIDVESTNQYFATANHLSAAYIYSFSNNAGIVKLTGHDRAVLAVKFHPNGIYVATGSEDCTVRLFEVQDGSCVRLFVGHIFGVRVIDFSYDGSLIASADSSGMVKVFDIKDCTVISKLALRARGEIYSVIKSLCFHEKNLVLAVCNEKCEVVFFDARNPQKRKIVRCTKKPIKITRHISKAWNVVYMCDKPKKK